MLYVLNIYYINTDHLCRRLSNERLKQQRMLKIEIQTYQDDIDLARKWSEKYDGFLRDKIEPPSTAWFDPSLLCFTLPSE